MTDLTLFILLLLCAFSLSHPNIKNRYFGAWLLFLCLFLLYGLRHYTVGVDSLNYAYRYETLSDLSTFEPGLRWLMRGLHILCPHYPFLFLVLAFLFWGGLIKFYHKYTSSYWMAVFLFCALGGVNTIANNAIRQGIAVVSFLTAIPYALQKKWPKYYFFALIAFLFHRSSIIIFPLYFLLQQKFSIWKIIPLTISFVLALVFAEDITAFFFSDYERYLVRLENINIGKLVQLVLISVMAIIPFFYRYKNRLHVPNFPLNNMLLWLIPLYLLCAWGTYLSTAGQALGRLTWYFFPIVFLNLTNYLDTKTIKLKLVIFGALILLIFGYRLGVYWFSYMSTQVNIMYYYRFFWQ